MIANALLLIASTVNAATELSVDLYDGPTDCEDSERVKKGDSVEMHYDGSIDQSSETGEKGTNFDSSRERGETFKVTIGVGQVIKGWDEGLVGLCKGAKAKLTIPPEMGYGDAGAGARIPGGATLLFDVEVVDVGAGPPPEGSMFEAVDVDKDGKLSPEDIEIWFKGQGQPVPEGLWEAEDGNGDGFISWDEFSGPKGDAPPKYDGDEL